MQLIWDRNKLSIMFIFFTSMILWGNGFKPMPLYLVEPNVYIEFDENYISLSNPNWIIPAFSGTYQIDDENGFPYLIIDDIERGPVKFGFLYTKNNEEIILYDTLSYVVIFASYMPSKDEGLYNHFTFFHGFESSSFYTEVYSGKTFIYKANNLETWTPRLPWVEGSEGSGLGEWISFRAGPLVTRSLYIINGYYDPNRPYLYKKNNRIKEFRLLVYEDESYSTLKFENFYTLDDSIKLHEINLPGNFKYFKIEIQSVYRGTVYDDTCLTGLYTDERLGH